MKVERIYNEDEHPFCTVTFTKDEASAFFGIISDACVHDICMATGKDARIIDKLMSIKNYDKMLKIMKED